MTTDLIKRLTEAGEDALAEALHDTFHADNPSLDEVTAWKHKTHLHRGPWLRRARAILKALETKDE